MISTFGVTQYLLLTHPRATVDFADPKTTSLCRSDRLQVPEKKSPAKPTVRLQPHYSFTPNLKFLVTESVCFIGVDIYFSASKSKRTYKKRG